MAEQTTLRCGIVGNSYTFYNDLPKMLARLSEDSSTKIECDSVTIGGAGLIKHQRHETEHILSGNYHFVTLQEHSCIPGGANPEELESSFSVLSSFFIPRLLANPNKPTIVLYSTWGHRDGVIPEYNTRFPTEVYPDYLTMQHKTTQGYEDYATFLRQQFPKVLVVPVGEAFEIIFHESKSSEFKFPELFHKLFDQIDTFHPSRIGTYIAACCFFGVLSGQSPKSLTWVPDMEATKVWDDKMKRRHGDKFQPEEISPDLAEYLKDVAHRAIHKNQSKI
eukprot:TRINITY_DN15295_c0_g1_i1.p1 TRINITY_DN15295_c0_g1~~TRINITY_DN15295_c0_g1_i1.p1  ORF type:complete len:278 (-),score=41.25 TRINITY_DN15295_c0_g1_i1:100-933(-)